MNDTKARMLKTSDTKKGKAIRALFLIGLMISNISILHAQTNGEFWAEEFMAEVFYGDMTEKSPKVYIDINTYTCSYIPSTEELKSMFFISDSVNVNTFVDGFLEYRKNIDNHNLWNKEAPVFQQSKYKNLIFVDGISKLSARKKKRMDYRKQFSKPIFTMDGEYALIEEVRWVVSPRPIKKKLRLDWKIIDKVYEAKSEGYIHLYVRINGKWIRIGSCLMWL